MVESCDQTEPSNNNIEKTSVLMTAIILSSLVAWHNSSVRSMLACFLDGNTNQARTAIWSELPIFPIWEGRYAELPRLHLSRSQIGIFFYPRQSLLGRRRIIDWQDLEVVCEPSATIISGCGVMVPLLLFQPAYSHFQSPIPAAEYPAYLRQITISVLVFCTL